MNDCNQLYAEVAQLGARVNMLELTSGEGMVREDRRVVPIPSLSTGGASMPEPFDIVDGKVVNCTIPCPVTAVDAADYTIGDTQNSTVYLHIAYANGAYTATVNQTAVADDATHASFVLYKFYNGKVKLDCRPKTLPLFAI